MTTGRPLAVALAAALAAAPLGCGTEVPAGGVPRTPASKPALRQRVSEATDLLPADLDLVVRVDLSRVRSSLGPEPSADLIDRALHGGGEGLLRRALAAAEVVWLGLRVADFEAGDRVLVVRMLATRPPEKPPQPDEVAWTASTTDVDGVKRYRAKVTPGRGETERVFMFDERTAVFVSPVESMSVERILRRGPDAERGQPEARGLLSLDYRPRRLSLEIAQRFPSLSGLVAGVIRMGATVDISGERLELSGSIHCRSAGAAAKLLRFLETIRDASARRPRFEELMAGLELSRQDATLYVAWRLPTTVVWSLIYGSDKRPAPPPEAGDDAQPEPPPAPADAQPERAPSPADTPTTN